MLERFVLVCFKALLMLISAVLLPIIVIGVVSEWLLIQCRRVYVSMQEPT